MYVNAQKCFNEDLGCVKEIQSEMFKTLYGINILYHRMWQRLVKVIAN